jgi:WS/DGAT/MGAT family acyltransferase
VSTRRRYASVDVALADVRRVRLAFGVTVNDVILATVGDALHHFLGRAGQLPDRSLVAMVPVSTRPGDDGGLGNQLSAFLVPLGTDLGDPVERLAVVAEASRAAKAHQAEAGSRLLADMAEVSAPALVAALARSAGGLGAYDRLPPLANVTVSSIPGPTFPIWCAGARVEALRPMGPVAHGIGLNVTTFSYQQTLSFGLAGCHRLVPDLEDLALLVDSALTSLVNQADQVQGRAG